MSATDEKSEAPSMSTGSVDRKKRSSFIPAPASSATSTPTSRRQPSKKLSKAQPHNRPSTQSPTTRPSQTSKVDTQRHGTALVPPVSIRTPSLVSGSSASTFDSPRSNVLRRKPSTIAKFVAQRSEASSVNYKTTADDAVFGISMPTIVASHSPFPSQAERAQWNTSQPMSLSSLGITSSDTPSTRYTESPFSHMEAPSSCSSVSPSATTRPHAYKDMHGTGRHLMTATSPSQPRSVSVRQVQLASPRSGVTTSGLRTSSAQPGRADSKISKTHPGLLLASPELAAQSSTSRSKATNPLREGEVAARGKVKIFPELAHLNDHAGSRPTYTSPTQMSRYRQAQLPQRNSSLEDMRHELSPPVLPQQHRAESRGSMTSNSSQSLRSRLGLTSRSLSKLGSGSSIRIAQSPSPAAGTHQDSKPSKLHATQVSGDEGLSDTAKTLPHKSSRFGFLSRKGRADTPQPIEKPKREPRKGPAAGTGHERYGKFGFRGRSGSTTSTSDSRSPSTGSQRSGFSDRFLRRKGSAGTQDSVEMDDFLKERLKPKVLRGSGSNFSAVSSPSVYSATEDREDSVFDGLSRVSTSQSHNHDANSATSSATGLPFTTISLQRSTNEPPRDAVSPISISDDVVQNRVRYPSAGHAKSHPALREPNNSSVANLKRIEADEGFWLRPMEPEQKPANKWNFLQRVRSSPLRTKPTRTALDQHSPDNKKERFDNAAHFALLDAVEPVTLDEVERLVASPSRTSPTLDHEAGLAASGERRQPLLPLPPSLGITLAQSPDQIDGDVSPIEDESTGADDRWGSRFALMTAKATTATTPPASNTCEELKTPDPSSAKDSPRIPRLSPVGRIPMVKSGRDRDRKLPSTSFSRPFAHTQPRPTVKPPGTLYSQIRDVASPAMDANEPSSATSPQSESIAQSQQSTAASSRTTTVRESRQSASYPGFSMFSFPSRKNSDFSYTSSSDTTSYAAFAYSQAFEQEDVWHEYNDLLDEVTLDRSARSGQRSHTDRSAATSTSLPQTKDRTIFVPKNLPSPPPEQALPSPPRSQGHKAPSSITSSLNGKLEGLYGVRSQQQNATGSTTSSRNSQISSRSRSMSYQDVNVRSSHTSFSSGADYTRRSRVSMISFDDDGKSGLHPAVKDNFDALMTSKWLSFDRVLFSPAHNETRFADDPRILILDGLGDEWSYFVAETYPQATVYNLELTCRQGSRKNQLPPPTNHRKIYHAAVGAPLPFPKGFFTAAVLRFPVATTDQAYHTTIAEFKRVLRPGGYLEISVLDIDLRGMGSIARKAVRGLKTRMQQQQEAISLRSLSDFVLQSIGKRGFEEVQRCIVGVPVVSRSVHTNDLRALAVNRSSANLSAIQQRKDMLERQRVDESGGETDDTCDSCVGEENDDQMTRKVARVGRWWYSMCYERAVPKTDQSIWKDEALIQECYENGTSFQMLMCHAQKPIQVRRHTRSV